ncbi:MAG: SIMPL domain-containing protein [Pseudomonadota bacterium]|nr:SIMPL domain-containing protein [Pseudomonadota bacterium]
MQYRYLLPSALILAIGMAAAGWLAGRGLVESRLGHRTVLVKGFSERVVKADLGFWPIRFTVSGPTLEEARRRLDAAEGAVEGYLEKHGFKAGDREIQNIQVEDRKSGYNSNNVDEESRFVLTEDMIVRSGDVDGLAKAARNIGDLIRAGVVLTSDQYNSGPSFVFTKLNELKPEMLTEATKRARDSAEQFARESGSKVGAIFDANQGLFTIGPAIEIPNERGDKQVEKLVRVVTTITYFLRD